MMRVVALYGTESGNAEMIAEDLAEALETEVEVEDMSEFDVTTLDASTFYLIVCSTHGEGDLPSGAQPFFDALTEARVDLTGMRYAMFGLGDRSYAETYSQGSEHIDRLFAELGAVRVGEYGRHDASSFDDASELAVAWAQSSVDACLAQVDPAGS